MERRENGEICLIGVWRTKLSRVCMGSLRLPVIWKLEGMWWQFFFSLYQIPGDHPFPAAFFPLYRGWTITESMIAAAGSFHSQVKVFTNTGAVFFLSGARAQVPQSTHYTIYSPYYHHIQHLSWKEATNWHWLETFAFWCSNHFWWRNTVLGNQWFCFQYD